MTHERFEAFLKTAIGLDASSIGSGAIDYSVRERAAACNCIDLDAYWARLTESADERQQLIESIVVPETWFFRDAGAFAGLGRLARERFPDAARTNRRLRLLSVPCSTGEEPYSMAMALLDAGVEPGNIAIDAVDVSARAIEYARVAQYKKNSFRGGDQGFRSRHFTADRLRESVRGCVQFRQANLFDLNVAIGNQRYDVVFCRNLLIYFDRATQNRAVEVLTTLLDDNGILVVGPSEGALLISHEFESINWPMSFAFRRPRARAAFVVVPAPSGVRAPQAPVSSGKGVVGSPVRRVPPHRIRVGPGQSNPPQHTQPVGGAEDLLRRAQQFADRGDGEAARECCERAIKTEGPSAGAYYLLGLLHDAAGESPRAMELYRRVLYLDPHHHEALIHLAILVEGAGNVVAARRLYTRAKRITSRGAGT